VFHAEIGSDSKRNRNLGMMEKLADISYPNMPKHSLKAVEKRMGKHRA
jgi:hypothetical protein